MLDDSEEHLKDLSAANTSFAIMIEPVKSRSFAFNTNFLVKPNADDNLEFFANYNDLINKIIPDFIRKSPVTMAQEAKDKVLHDSIHYLDSLYPFLIFKSKEGVAVKAIGEDYEDEEIYGLQALPTQDMTPEQAAALGKDPNDVKDQPKNIFETMLAMGGRAQEYVKRIGKRRY